QRLSLQCPDIALRNPVVRGLNSHGVLREVHVAHLHKRVSTRVLALVFRLEHRTCAELTEVGKPDPRPLTPHTQAPAGSSESPFPVSPPRRTALRVLPRGASSSRRRALRRPRLLRRRRNAQA